MQNLEDNTPYWGGVAFMLGSLLFLVNKLDEMSRLFFSRWMADVISERDTLLIIIGQVAFIVGYVGFWQLYSDRVGKWGKVALRLFCGGGIVLAVGHVTFMTAFLTAVIPPSLVSSSEYLFILVMIGVLLLIIGLVWFGILNLRQPVMARWQWLPLATAVMGFVGFFLFSGEEITAPSASSGQAVFLLFRTLFALGLLGLGLTMWLEKSIRLQVAA